MSWGPAQGQATTTLLLRHGQTPLSAERRFAGRGDIPLTDAGHRQAAAAAARLAERGGIDLIVTSPLQRARHTAEAVAAATGAPLDVEDGLAETDFGKWEGLTFAEAAEQWPDEMSAWLASTEAAPPDGESFAAVSSRVLGALDRLLAVPQPRTLLLASHVTPIKTLVCRAMLAPPAAMFRLHLDVASLCEIDWYADGPAVVRSLNDTGHLHNTGHRHDGQLASSPQPGIRPILSAAAGEPAGRPRRLSGLQAASRKVRAPQGRVVGNADPG